MHKQKHCCNLNSEQQNFLREMSTHPGFCWFFWGGGFFVGLNVQAEDELRNNVPFLMSRLLSLAFAIAEGKNSMDFGGD